MVNFFIYGMISLICTHSSMLNYSNRNVCKEEFNKCMDRRIWLYEDTRVSEYSTTWDIDSFIECVKKINNGEKLID